MDIRYTNNEMQTLQTVIDYIYKSTSETYDKAYNTYTKRIAKRHKKPSKKVIEEFVRKRDGVYELQKSIAEKIAQLLHFYRLNNTNKVSMLDLLEQIFLVGGKDFESIENRLAVKNIMQYFAACGSVQLLYGTIDLKQRVLFVQNPKAEIKNNLVKLSNIKLTAPGAYESEDQEQNGVKGKFCYIKGHKEDGVFINKNNYINYLAVFYLINPDPDIKVQQADPINLKATNQFAVHVNGRQELN